MYNVKGGICKGDNMKKTIAMMLILALSFMMFTGCNNNSGGANDGKNSNGGYTKEEILAKVNNEIITVEDFNKYYAMQSYDFEKEYGVDVWNIEQDGKTMKEIRQDQTIDYLIRVSLIKNYVTKNGFVIEDVIINEAYDKYMTSNEDDEKIKLYFEENGLNKSFLKKFLKDQLYLRVYQDQILEEIHNDSAKLESLFVGKYVRYKTSHILVEHEDKAKLEGIRSQIVAEEDPADFSLMARENSIHSTSAVRGGDLGYVTVGNMPKAYEEAALSIELYTVSEIVETEYGYHLIFVEDRQMISDMVESGMPEDEINGYKEEIINKYASDEFVSVFDEMKSKATIAIFKEMISQE